ncbi:putative bifunctional diguanylate cyclase/phosphodiesterase [Chitinimonas sp.]|uniref:putative bifunctional diguanylate cyclase/phosphodiesterase n=1 Tax=Chitinimonas sp. TaxID=1934313 RepID=UPI002F94B137
MLRRIRQQLFATRNVPVSLDQWRERVLSNVLLTVLVLGTGAALPNIVYALQQGLWSLLLTDVIALAWIGVLWRRRTLAYRTRAAHFLAVLYLIGLSLLFSVGPVSQIYLLASPVMAALLLGLRAGWVTLALTCLTLPLVGYLADLPLHVGGFNGSPALKWLAVAINFGLVSVILTVSAAVLLEGLRLTLAGRDAAARSLEAEQALLHQANEALRLTDAAVSHLNDIVVITAAEPVDEPGPTIVFVNHAFEQRTGYQREEALGQTLKLLEGPLTNREEIERIRSQLRLPVPVRAEVVAYRKDGSAFWLELDITPIFGADGRCSNFVMIQRDITERKKAEEDIHRLAYYDVLTGLPNRRLLMDRLAQALAAGRRKRCVGAVMYLDLDHFKHVNDARGHGVGDSLLRAVAERLAELLRTEDTVARLGGDEFVVLVPQLAEELEQAAVAAMAIAEKIRTALTRPFQIHGQRHHTGASIGITLFPREGQTGEQLLGEADMAMYRAKVGGRNRIAYFEAAMQTEIEERLGIQHQLERALGGHELQMYLQPQVDRGGRTIGAEMLMRWHHPERGFISPATFIPIAEDTGLILRLGHWALQEGCRSIVRLVERGHALPLSVNVSPQQFHEPDFVERLRGVLAETGAPASLLVLEVTEGLLIRDLHDTIRKMCTLAELGIRFSIDDFGTGYSSLAYLKRLPLQELKIDRSFVQDTPGNASDTAIVELIIATAKHLGLRVVAEGVERPEQADFLAQHGCDAMQGFLFARPMPVEEWLRACTQGTGA